MPVDKLKNPGKFPVAWHNALAACAAAPQVPRIIDSGLHKYEVRTAMRRFRAFVRSCELAQGWNSDLERWLIDNEVKASSVEWEDGSYYIQVVGQPRGKPFDRLAVVKKVLDTTDHFLGEGD